LKIKTIAILSLIIGLIILTTYSILLITNGYIKIGGAFSLENAGKIAPFIGSCVGVFFTLAGTLLVFENLQMTRINNLSNQTLVQKNQFETIFFNLLTQQRQIKDSIKTSIEFELEGVVETSGNNFFDDLATRVSQDYEKTEKNKDSLIKTYNYWFTIHNSDIGHFFRHLYHIVKFVDNNPYFETITKEMMFFNRKDYINILRAQLCNSEIALLAINGLTIQGANFKKYIEKYELLVNLNFELDMPIEYVCRVPGGNHIANEYKHLEGYYPKKGYS
jgi:hypothetical protein